MIATYILLFLCAAPGSIDVVARKQSGADPTTSNTMLDVLMDQMRDGRPERRYPVVTPHGRASGRARARAKAGAPHAITYKHARRPAGEEPVVLSITPTTGR
jgi:hypothetical protein